MLPTTKMLAAWHAFNAGDGAPAGVRNTVAIKMRAAMLAKYLARGAAIAHAKGATAALARIEQAQRQHDAERG
jgi:hypothetical protein